MAEHGQKGKFGNIDVKRMTLPDGSQIIVGYDVAGKEKWILKETGDEDRLLLDEDMDGGLDRMVLNKGVGLKGEKKATNELNAFIPMSQLSKDAKVEADLDPQQVFVYKIEKDAEGFKIKAVNFTTGETEELTGVKAEETSKKLQEMFAKNLE